ncbi:MAG: hypothetical protein JW938_04135 [Candidatus Omnitrophica bacterium]|nr:hypothetical protein [Candidatus Omnitrophota bacterium]
MPKGDKRSSSLCFPATCFEHCRATLPFDIIRDLNDHVLVFIEPHPDDTVLGAGGLVQLIAREIRSHGRPERIHNVTVVSGYHAVDDTFIEALSEKDKEHIFDRYHDCLNSLYSAISDNDIGEEEAFIRGYYEDCLKYLDRLKYEQKDRKRHDIILKSGLRLFIENKNAFVRLAGKDMVKEHYVLLPFYDSIAGFTPALDHVMNVVALGTVIEQILKKSGKRKLTIVADAGKDPHGTHGLVRSVLNRTVLSLIEEEEIEAVTYYWMHGPWPVMNFNNEEQACVAMFTEDIWRDKYAACAMYVSQQDPLVPGSESTPFRVRVEERNREYAKLVRKHNKTIQENERYAELYFRKDFLDAGGSFEYGRFKDYIDKIEG